MHIVQFLFYFCKVKQIVLLQTEWNLYLVEKCFSEFWTLKRSFHALKDSVQETPSNEILKQYYFMILQLEKHSKYMALGAVRRLRHYTETDISNHCIPKRLQEWKLHFKVKVMETILQGNSKLTLTKQLLLWRSL